MNSPKELMPCPFCGSKASASQLITEGAVQCIDCKALIVKRNSSKKEDGMKFAIKAWNTRKLPEQQRQGNIQSCSRCGDTHLCEEITGVCCENGNFGDGHKCLKQPQQQEPRDGMKWPEPLIATIKWPSMAEVKDRAYVDGFNDCLAQCKALNSAPERLVELDDKDRTAPLDEWVDEQGLQELRKEFKCHIDNANPDEAVRFCLMSLRNHVRLDSRPKVTLDEIENIILKDDWCPSNISSRYTRRIAQAIHNYIYAQERGGK